MFRNLHTFCLSLFLTLGILRGQAQTESVVLSGRVSSVDVSEDLIGATIYIKELKTGVATDTRGKYKLRLPPGTYTVTITYIGYESKEQVLRLTSNQHLDFELKPFSVAKQEVVITGERNNKNVTSTEVSRIELSGEKIKTLPVIFGEPDILKTITLLPGIKSGGEGSTGFYVRGGGPDQNLIMMDEAVIYNPSHLLGFLSVFNTDAVKSVDIIKGGMPAQFGGRLSSVINVSMREGNDEKFVVNGGVGLIASRLQLEGPIKKKKSGFVISGRRTYIDQLVKPFLSEAQKSNGYHFYDLNAKFHWYFSERDKLYFSGYFGRDVFNFISPRNKDVNFQTGWGNATATLRWYHLFNTKVVMNTAIIYNRFDLTSSFNFGNNGFNLASGLEDWNLKQDITINTEKKNHTFKLGWQYIYHTFKPGIASGQVGTIKINQEINKQYAHEMAAYASDEMKLGARFVFNAGLRAVTFTQTGPFTEKIFDDQDLEIGTGRSYKSGEPIVTYPGLEPRLAATYLINSTTSVKASFTRTYQFLHLATTSGAQFPADLWVPSSLKVKPQIAYQYVLGYYRNFHDNEYESSVEAYYKPMYNQIEFKPGAQLFFNQNLENEMVFGQGLSYGVESFLRKKTGRLNGWVGYTWSRTTRQFDKLNGGESFYYRYDRTHDMSLVASYKINEKWTGTVVFVYGTGNAATLPTSRYSYNPGYDLITNKPKITFIDVYEKINSFRLPDYHRMDLSFTYQRRKHKRYESTWNFSIYNLYNRANPYFIYFVPDINTLTVKAYMVYLFPILPSAAWNFKF